MNKVLLTGRLTRDAESRSTPSGNTVFNFGLAVPEGKDKVTFVEIEAWDNVAAGISPYLTVGKGIEVEGRLKVDEWEDKTDGKKRKAHKVVAERLSFSPGGSSKKEDGEGDETPKSETKSRTSAGKAVSGKKAGKTAAPVAVTTETDTDDEGDDSVPF